MNTITDIKQGLMDILGTVDPSGGFQNVIAPDHIRGFFDGAWIDNKTDVVFPKVMVVLDGGKNEQLAVGQFHRKLFFKIFVYVKQLQPNQSDQIPQIESFIEDIEKVIEQNSSLNGFVNNCVVDGFITDGGILAPEGCANLDLEVFLA